MSEETTAAVTVPRGAVLALNKSNPDVTEYQLYSLPLGSMFRCHYPNMAGDIPHTYPPRQLPNRHPFDEGWLLDVTQGRCVVYVTSSEKRESYAHETPVEFLGVDDDMAKLIEEEQGKAERKRHATRPHPVPELTPTELLRHHVTGAIERGEAEAIVEELVGTSNQHLPDNPKHRSIVVRWNFQLKQLVGALEGENDAKAEQARKAIIKIADDATEQGMTSLPSEVEFSPLLQDDSVFTLDEVARLLVAAPAVAMSKNMGSSAGESRTNSMTAANVEAPVAGSVQDGKQKAKAKAAAAKQTSGASTPAPAKEKKAPKPLNDCLDGCGAKVKGRFAMGHDAKLKSLILKIERGDEARDTIPEVAQPYVSFVKGETEVQKIDGKDVKVQLYNCTKAPVRFPGRNDIEYAE